MKHIPISTLSAAIGGLIIAAGTATALASSGYAQDSAGKVVTSGFGECVQTSEWSKNLSTAECDPALAARLKAEKLAAEEAARRSAELAALERAAPPPAPPALVRLSDKRNVMFEFNSAKLTPAADTELTRLLGKLDEFKDVEKIEIVGHTDSTGPESYNQTLSEKRAESVKRYLESRGVKATVLSARGVGESGPIADNRTRDGRAKNRRVDVLIDGETLR